MIAMEVFVIVHSRLERIPLHSGEMFESGSMHDDVFSV